MDTQLASEWKSEPNREDLWGQAGTKGLFREEKAFPLRVPYVAVPLLRTMAKEQGVRPAGLWFEKMVGKI